MSSEAHGKAEAVRSLDQLAAVGETDLQPHADRLEDRLGIERFSVTDGITADDRFVARFGALLAASASTGASVSRARDPRALPHGRRAGRHDGR